MLSSRLNFPLEQAGKLRQALTHRSFSATHNERLEFLGDSVLNLCISGWLMQRLPDASEGELSRTRANLVCEASLHRIALELALPSLLLLGEGERKTGGAQRASILADAVEALIGVVYLEQGFEAVQRLVLRLFGTVDLSATAKAKAKDPKTSLQEWLQGKKMALPLYHLDEVRGVEHQQEFIVSCSIPALQLQAQGIGTSRKTAERMAAAAVLDLLMKKGKKA
ncbi:ribonuclease III [Lampropedia puyangensis]|uniref:Ribonuclease 3 n=1 Tax=Lampropedia puyangensis TaxID=1330072 RepID=A0A4S8FCB6_9BURK|nr:ribonuclease III [Lampropedia puyangensis]THU04174.1 ribonuclease III [Lampropedia puyangensis]